MRMCNAWLVTLQVTLLIGDIVDSEGDYQELQQDFDQLGKWVEE